MANQPLPVFDTVTDSYRTVWSLIGFLPAAAALPLFLSLLISIPIILQPTGGGLGMLSMLLETIPYTLFAVAWHRLVLLGPSVAPPRLALYWKPHHWRYLGYSLMFAGAGALVLTYALAAVETAPLSPGESLATSAEESPGVGPLFAFLLLIAMCYLTIRLFFVLPATALDEAYQLQHSWMHTKGQALRLVAALFVTMLPVVVVTMIVAQQLMRPAAAGDLPAPSSGHLLIVQIVMGALGYVGTALSTTAIALAFRRLAGWYPGDQHKLPSHA